MDSARSSETGGAGLGLAIVDAVCRVSRLKVGYRFVEGMHQMEVYS